jgi:TolA-binding protein
MSEQPRHVSEFVRPEVVELRLNRMWAQIAAADARRTMRPRVWMLGSVGAMGVLAVAVAVFALTRPHLAPLQPASEFASADAARTAILSDGSTIELAAQSSLRLESEAPEQTRVQLRAGAATFEVARRPTRQFFVEAGDVRIRVVGTRFTVRHDALRTQVRVDRGIVEVSFADQKVQLVAGQTWSSPLLPVAPTEAALVPSPEQEEEDEVLPPSKVPAVKLRGKGAKAKSRAVEPAAPLPPTASELFQAAIAARREGKVAEAAAGFERFLATFGTDARAPVAALELGRIRMDLLHDVPAALEALQRSLALDPAAGFREEALSRLVRGYDELGNRTRCREARSAYLGAFPSGAYATSVRARCGGDAP